MSKTIALDGLEGLNRFSSMRLSGAILLEVSMSSGVYQRSEDYLKRLKKQGFQKGHTFKRGALHHYWRGGVYKDRGYVFIHSPDHPFKNKNYVPEHRLIMEKYLGRYLRPEEVVHHINEVTDDNRIENLMLFKNDAEHTKHHHSKREKENIV